MSPHLKGGPPKPQKDNTKHPRQIHSFSAIYSWLVVRFNPFETYAKVKLDHLTRGIRDEHEKTYLKRATTVWVGNPPPRTPTWGDRPTSIPSTSKPVTLRFLGIRPVVCSTWSPFRDLLIPLCSDSCSLSVACLFWQQRASFLPGLYVLSCCPGSAS